MTDRKLEEAAGVEAKSDPVAELRALLGRAGELVAELARCPAPPGELEMVRAECVDLAQQMMSMERRVHQLLNLYVATYQLYAARDPAQVQETIAEIASDLLGAERFVLLLRSTGHGECRVALARGFDSEGLGPYASGVYRGGDAIVDRTLAHGVRHLAPESRPIAVVPLQVDEHVVGALILIKLVGHKARLSVSDSEVLDLLGAHAASALTASEAYAVTSRKLQTLESLIQLARGAP